MTQLVVTTRFLSAALAVLAQNIQDRPVFFINDANPDAFTITLTGGDFEETFTTDYLGNPITQASITAAGAGGLILRKVFIDASGGTGDGATLMVVPSIRFVEGTDDMGDPSFQHKIDGVLAQGAFSLTKIINQSVDGGKDFSVVETFAGTTIESDPVTMDAFAGSYTATDVGALFWHDPNNITTSAGLLTAWPNSAVNSDSRYDLDTVPTGSAAPLWDAVNVKATNDGTRSLTTGRTGNFFVDSNAFVARGETHGYFVVADTPANSLGTLIGISQGAGTNQSISLGTENGGSGEIEVYILGSRFSQLFGNFAGGINTINNPAIGKRLLEWRISATEVTFYVDGRLEWTGAVSPGSIDADSLSIFARASASGAGQYGIGSIYESFATKTTAIFNDVRAELAGRHGITLL